MGVIPAPDSRTPQGVRGLKCRSRSACRRCPSGRTPQGVRGLKLVEDPKRVFFTAGRAPQGARGLKSGTLLRRLRVHTRRAPQGARGLKWRRRVGDGRAGLSHPARGAAKESPILVSDATCVEENISRPATVRAASRQVFRQNHTGAVIDRPGSLYSRGAVPRCARQICSSTSLASWYAMSAL